MEESKKIDISGRPEELTGNGGNGMPHCSFWIFGNEESARKDLNDKFEIVDEKGKDNK